MGNAIRELIALTPISAIAVPLTKIFGKSLGVSLGDNVKMIGGVYLGPNTTIGGNTKIFRGVCITGGQARTRIGEDSFIGRGAFIEASEDVTIGHHVAIAPGVHIFTHDSAIHWLSHHQLNMSTGPVSIGDNCYIGTGAFILKGVTIGNNSVIGANSVVTKDVPPDSVAIGCPANVYCGVKEYFNRAGHDWDLLTKL